MVRTTSATKLHDIGQILTGHLPPETDGGAIVYCATRRATEQVAHFLNTQEINADRFHAGLPPEEKKDIQQSFIEGRLRVIAATNAFGMGIDKPDVRLVIHADIPSSLENYLQEAGRAGRDQEQARCVLLYTSDDVERQFGMSARSRLTRREIHGVLRALRALNRRDRCGGQVVASPGEILGEDEEKAFRRDSTTDDTRVRTAVAWLEEARLLTREANDVRVFPSSLRVNSLQEVRQRLRGQPIDADYRRRLESIAEALINAKSDESISTDVLMDTAGLSSEQVRGALHDLERFGIASDDTQLTAFVHVGVRNPSHSRLTQAAQREQRLIELMQELAPDLTAGERAPLNLRVAAQRLRDDGHGEVRPEHVSRLIQGIAGDGRGETGSGSLTVRKHDTDSVLVTLGREWSKLAGMAERRRNGADRLLKHLLALNPPNNRGSDLLVATTLGKLTQAAESDMTLLSQNGDEHRPRRLMERSLLWLHEQDVIRLNRGLTVFRPAMTIRLNPEPRGFRQTDFGSLAQHYDGSVRQIHVMAEYAQRGLANMADALRLTLDYFTVGEDAFLRRWLPDRGREFDRQTTPESWTKIVESLNNPNQRNLVADNRETTNVLVLAGPGSGKTRVLVHRIAYLIRARREDPRGILALAYNRHAAVEIRRRLRDLIGDDARGVMVFTCHALAMRLVGASFSGQADRETDADLSERLRAILREATALLRGEGLEPEEAEESRARLLAGFRWILVDEYQDIAADEYALISALAGRTLTEEDSRLSLFAVGDDDQNIYSFNGSSVEFIRSFEKDYSAKPGYLIDNYRSTRHIIDAANAVIGPARDRMKADHAIQINQERAKTPAGGRWAERDPVAHGKVQVLRSADDSAIAQAQTAVAELRRLSSLDQSWDWSMCAVIARQWSYLEPVRTLCERDGIPVQMANEDNLSLWHLRETQALVNWVRQRDPGMLRTADVKDWLDRQPARPVDRAVTASRGGTRASRPPPPTVPTASFIEWLAEWVRDARRRQSGLLLLTAHRAKGLEFAHVVVLDGGWDRINRNEDPGAPRRLYYVAMTRARHTLALSRLAGPHPFQDGLRDDPSAQWRDPTDAPATDPGARPPPSPTHPERRVPELRRLQAARPPHAPRNRRVGTRRSIAGAAKVRPVGTPQLRRSRRRDPGTQVRGPHRHALHQVHSPRHRHLEPRPLRPAVPATPQERHLGGSDPRTRLRAPHTPSLTSQALRTSARNQGVEANQVRHSSTEERPGPAVGEVSGLERTAQPQVRTVSRDALATVPTPSDSPERSGVESCLPTRHNTQATRPNTNQPARTRCGQAQVAPGLRHGKCGS